MFPLASLLLATALALPASEPDIAAEAAAQPPPADTIMRIPPQLDALLYERVLRRSSSQQERLQLLVRMIFDDDGLALHYGASDTHTVAETFTTRRANCLSFSLLLVALSRRAGIYARPQEVGQVLGWYAEGGTAYNYGHINAQVRIDGRTGTVDLDSNILMDRRGPHPISDTRAFAHYYNNRGAELMGKGELALARRYFDQALHTAPDLTEAWNNLGVLDYREQNYAAAASDYAMALSLQPRHAASLSNAINLYRRLGDNANVARLVARLEDVRDADPFHQYVLGTEAETRGDYPRASRYYARAIRLYPDAHQFHFGLARVAFLSGDSRLAERELRRARALGPPSEQARYQAKLDSLKRWSAAGTPLPR